MRIGIMLVKVISHCLDHGPRNLRSARPVEVSDLMTTMNPFEAGKSARISSVEAIEEQGTTVPRVMRFSRHNSVSGYHPRAYEPRTTRAGVWAFAERG